MPHCRLHTVPEMAGTVVFKSNNDGFWRVSPLIAPQLPASLIPQPTTLKPQDNTHFSNPKINKVSSAEKTNWINYRGLKGGFVASRQISVPE
jgi:hypothetical protein